MTTLRDATLALERGVNDALGDEITYTFADGSSVTFNAWVEFDTTIVNPGNSAAAADAVRVEVPMDLVADPVAGDRITVALLPGKVWAMKGRDRGSTGATWVLPLKKAGA
ncbi:hypothetical protein [Sphingomonas sp. NFR15]|uniref:head-tail joining protein n=1 Tax=Sphingomonas sp. NFR15 TaxID=1566282 RepID=UPI00088A8901|nr:hypothetical protein [Sphingomonas sp. NFR15]SDA14959.1 hypothetical protein SAMN03159340_00619 [Sphingomonas sp. NFR15]